MKTAAQLIDEIEARVRPTICPTFGMKDGEPSETLEGRISAVDLDTILKLYRSRGKITVDYIHLRTIGSDIVVLVEVGGKEYPVITEHREGPISHCVHPGGVEAAINRSGRVAA